MSASSPPRTVPPLARGVALAAEGVTRRFGAVEAISGVSLELAEGDLTAVVGPPHSGKSTLLALLGGLDRPSSGSIEIEGVELTGLADRALARLRRRRIGLVAPPVGLVPGLSVEENVLLPLRLAGTGPERAFVEDVLHRCGLRELRSLRPVELTLEERRHAELARALVTEPAVVLADDPAAGLGPDAADGLLALRRGAGEDYGQAALLATTDARAAAIAPRVHRLADGALVGAAQ